MAPISQEALDSPPSLAEGGPPAPGPTHSRTGPPGGPTEGGAAAGAAAAGLRAAALDAAWLRARWRVEGLGPGLGAGQDSRPGDSAGRGEGGTRRGFHPRMRIRTFAFTSLPLLLKSKSYNL